MDDLNNASKKETASTAHDALLECLTIFSQLSGILRSKQALLTGLPLVNGRLTPELFVRAAERVGLKANIETCSLRKIGALTSPVILLLREKQACVLTEITDKQTAKVLRLQNNTLVTEEINLPELEFQFSGSAIFTEPVFRFTDRSEEMVAPRAHDWFWRVVRLVWPLYTETLIASFLINLFALATPIFTMNVYDRVVPNHAIETLWVLAIGVMVVLGFDVLMRILRSYFIDIGAKKIDLSLSATIFEQIMGIKMADRPESVGTLANTVYSFESFRDFITSTTITVLVDLPFAIVFLIAILLLGGSLVWIPIILIPLGILLGFLLQKPLNEHTKTSYRYASEKQATLYETLSHIETIKANNAEGVMQHKWEQVISLASRLNIKLKFVVNLGIYFSLFIQQIASVIMVIVGVYMISKGELTTGALIACTILVGRALAPASQISALLTRYHQSLTSLEAVDKIMNLPIDRPPDKHLLARPTFHKGLEFRAVNFTYPGQTVPVLNDISFKIQAGERVGIIGRVGSGKSTIAKLLLGFYQATSGMLLLDDTQFQQFDLADVRHQIGYMPQDIALFYGSIRDNITFGAPPVTATQIQTASTLAGVEEFTHHHPQGLEIQVGESGKNLSGGQRQIVAIARSILLDPPLLIFDEPSNSMDDKTENLFKARFLPYLDGKTFIITTHRASMLALVQRLIVLDKGRIVADGPRDEILQALAQGKVKLPQA